MTASDTGYNFPISAINSSASLTFNSNIGAPDSTLTFFADKLDGQGAPRRPGTLLESVSATRSRTPIRSVGSRITAFAARTFAYRNKHPWSCALIAQLLASTRAWKSTAVPEPSTWAMGALGFGRAGDSSASESAPARIVSRRPGVGLPQ